MIKKGFTLIELLAVIVILAIILAIAIPGISGIIKSSTKGAFESDAKMVLKAIEYKKLENEDFNPLTITQENIQEELKINKVNYAQVTFSIVDDKVKVVLVGAGKFEGLTAYGTFKSMRVVNSDDYDVVPPVITMLGTNPRTIDRGTAYTEPGATATDLKDGNLTANIVITGSVNIAVVGTYTITYSVSDAMGNNNTVTRTVNVILPYNPPVLAAGMTPIKWDGSSWVTTTEDDIDWHNYSVADKKWANARTADGSMWVWIPRYAYRISSGYHTNTAGTVNVKFLQNNTNTVSDGTQIYEDNASNNHFVKHPAFTFGTTELTGIWIAKFEMSGSTSSLDSKPGVASLRSITVGNMFTASRNMETNNKYGWALASGLNADGTFTTNTNNVDTHMMKNVEWGAVAYLAQSLYGKNAEITINSSSSYYTGGGTGNAYATNVGQSTTGTIYGIYDISGGAYEYVMGNYNNIDGSSGLTVSSINDKYIDRYTSYSATKYGDAMYETSSSSSGSNSWYGDYSNTIETSYPWPIRGGSYGGNANSGAFYFNNNYAGGGGNTGTWRSVVLVGTGL